MRKLSRPQVDALNTVLHHGAEPMPPMNTLHSLRRLDLIEVINDASGDLAIVATRAGREAIEDLAADPTGTAPFKCWWPDAIETVEGTQ